MRRPPRRTRPQVGRGAVRALAAYVIGRRHADLAFCEANHCDGNSIGNPMNHSHSTSAFRVHHGKREALRSRRRIGPRQRRRNIFTDAVRVVLPIAGVLLCQRRAVLKRRRRQNEWLGSICNLRHRQSKQHPASQQEPSKKFSPPRYF